MAGQGELAEEIRTGLEEEPVSVVEVIMQQEVKKDILDELYFRKPIRRHLREFAVIFTVILGGLGGWRFYKYGMETPAMILSIAALCLIGVGVVKPKLLYWPWKGWMALAHKIGVVMSFLIVTAAWFVVTMPIAMVVKLCRKELLDLSYNADVKTYWEDRDDESNDWKRLETQY